MLSIQRSDAPSDVPTRHQHPRRHAMKTAAPPHIEPAAMPASPKPKLGPLGAQPALSETAAMVQQTVHRFAEEVLRPVGIQLDKMAPDAVIAPGSPFWKAREQYLDLGFTIESIFELEPAERA